MGRIVPGRPLSAAMLENIRGRAEGAMSPQVADGLEVDTAGGNVAFAPWLSSELPPYCQYAKLVASGGASAPRMGVAELCGGLAGGKTEPILQVRLPSWTGIAPLIVFTNGVAENKIVPVQLENVCPVIYYKSSIPAGTTLAAGHRLGARRGSFYAQWDEGGPLFVQSVEQTYSEAEQLGVAVVEITRKRFDSKMVDTGGQCDGAYELIIWGGSYAVAANGVGTPKVS